MLTEAWAEAFSFRLALHHRLCRKPLSKEIFEYAAAETFQSVKVKNTLTAPNHPGADIEVYDEKWSLKTQADSKIRPDIVNIHKIMEAGKGTADSPDARRKIVSSFHEHLSSYHRLMMLRCLPATESFEHPHYELIEIPTSLLKKAARFPISVAEENNNGPAAFHINVVSEENGSREFQLYFDGGSERKLRIKHLRRDLCISHISWSFPKK